MLLGVAPRFYHGCGGVAGVDPGRGREGQAVIAQDAPQIEAGPKLGPARAERRSRLMGKKGVLVQPHGLREEGQGDGSREAREPHHRDENLPPPEHHDPPRAGKARLPPPPRRAKPLSPAPTPHTCPDSVLCFPCPWLDRSRTFEIAAQVSSSGLCRHSRGGLAARFPSASETRARLTTV